MHNIYSDDTFTDIEMNHCRARMSFVNKTNQDKQIVNSMKEQNEDIKKEDKNSKVRLSKVKKIVVNLLPMFMERKCFLLVVI